VFLYVFDLIEFAGSDLRRELLKQRKADLRQLLADAGPGLQLNGWIDGSDFDGATVFEHACKLGVEGIVSKRKDSRYVSGRSPYWLKMKNPASAAVWREAEEDWGG
jgi:bifunctional non-homologous end joining protein LigD